MLRWIALLLLLPTVLLAQRPIPISAETNVLTLFPLIGARISGGADLHRAQLKQLPGFPNCCPQYRSGEGIGLSLAGYFQLPLTPYLALQFAGAMQWRSGQLSQIDSNASILQPDGGIRKAVTEYRLQNKITSIHLRPSIQAFLLDFPLSLRAGLDLGYTLSGTFDEKEILLSPQNATFENYRTTRNEQSGNIPDLSPWTYGFTIAIGYVLPISRTMRLIPELQYTHQLNTVLRDSLWRIHSLQIGVTLALPLIPGYPPPPTYPKIPTVLPAPIITPSVPKPPPPALRLALDVTGVFSDGTSESHPAIVLEEQELKESFPLLPSVFFPQSVTDLTRTRQVLLQPEQTRYFTPTSLPADALAIYRHLLNIIGYRLRQHPQATITLTALTVPSRSGRTIPVAVAQARAKAVKAYLVNVWHIQPKRISIRTKKAAPPVAGYQWQDDLWEELERVEITSPNDAITAPVQIRHISRTISPQKLLIHPAITAEAGIREFTLQASLQRFDTTLFHATTAPDTLLWELHPNTFAHVAADSLQLTAQVIDSANQRRTVTTTLPFTSLTVDLKRQIGSKDTLIEKFSLILFAFDKANLGPRNRKILKTVIQQIRPNSHITILGYTDRIGLKDYNKKLAAARCKEVMKALEQHGVQPAQISFTAVGSDYLLYNNDLPEGRSYSRTVQIIIKTPLTPE